MIKKKFYQYLGILTIFFGIYYLVFYFDKNQTDFVRALDATPEMFQRSFISDVFLQTSNLSDASSIFRPATLRVYHEKIYISDFSDFSIHVFDKQGNQIKKIETGRGRGPGEFQNLTDFDLIRDTLWIVDVQNLKISSFSLETGEVIDNISVDMRPLRITCLEDSFIVQWIGSELLFSRFDYDGNVLSSFGKIIEDQQQHVLSLSGTIRSNRKDRFVYIPYYASLIYHYHESGELINVIKTPDGVHFPTARKVGAQSFAPDFVYMRDALIADDDRLYVYTRIPADISSEKHHWESQSVIDIYNLADAKYETSIQIPIAHSTAVFDSKDNLIFSIDKEKGKVYTHKIEE